MSYRWVEHTAELELEVEAPTEEAVFADALHALTELLAGEDPPPRPEGISMEVSLRGHDRALLLADWLDELAFLAETEGVIPEALDRIDLAESGLTATVRGLRGPARPLVKGVTHHRLTFGPSPGGFTATVVIDV